MAIAFECTIPVLRIFSVDKARDFYGGFLGFKEEWMHRFAPAAPVAGRSAGGRLYRIAFRYGGADPRIGLREQASLSAG